MLLLATKVLHKQFRFFVHSQSCHGAVDQGKPTYYSRLPIPDLLRLPSVVSRTLAPAAAA